jgi:hypothetical protein
VNRKNNLRRRKMRPQQGDSVKLTDHFLNKAVMSWVPALRDVELLVTKLKLRFTPFKIYTIYFMVNNMMNKLDVNEHGYFVDSSNNATSVMVFEPYYDTVSISSPGMPLIPRPVNVPTPAWVPTAPAQPSRPVTTDEANTSCPQCGSPAIDLIFSVKCTNPDCRNYK